MIPTRLDDWTLDAIRKLLAAGVFEKDSFDWKEQLPDSRNAEEKLGLTIDCAAFANADGGFLIFGVKDDRSSSPDDRMVGVEARDFPAQFGDYPRKCSPSVRWDFKQEGLVLPSGSLLHVVYIPASWRVPHGIELPGQQGTFRFPIRTNKGTEYMPISEVHAMFLGLQEKTKKLDLLRSELDFLAEVTTGLKEGASDPHQTRSHTYDLAVLGQLLGELYVLLERDPELVKALNQIRKLASEFPDEADKFRRESQADLLLVGSLGERQASALRNIRNHNAFLQRQCTWLLDTIKVAKNRLAQLTS